MSTVRALTSDVASFCNIYKIINRTFLSYKTEDQIFLTDRGVNSGGLWFLSCVLLLSGRSRNM